MAYKLGSVTVINGVVYESNPKRIGKNQITVPSGYWKIIANDEHDFQKCFYYENNNDVITKQDKLKQHQVECSTLIKQ
jgi:endonuclease G